MRNVSSWYRFGTLVILIAGVEILSLPFGAQAQTAWVGTDGNFTDSANWDNGVPNNTTAATILNAGVTPYTVTASNGVAYSLSLPGSGTVALVSGTGSPLTLGQLTVTDGTAIISTALTADGADFLPTTPNTTALHRNAILVSGGGTIALESGADVSVKNDAGNTAFLRVGYGAGESGALTITNGATLSVGQASRYANFLIGDGIGASGSVVQSGGQVTVLGSLNIGTDGGSGAYEISGGTLTLDHANDAFGSTSLFTIGHNNNTSGPATVGVLSISGGLVEILPTHGGSSNFIIGNRVADKAGGNGTITQTGGTFRVGAGAGFYLSGYGDGIYNLNGGALEIGGTSLQARYGGGSATGTYAFNLGGGTIRVIGSDLVTSVNAGLTASTTSVFDTNGLNATWSGLFTGTGNLAKIGLGDLRFTNAGTRSLGTFWVVQGSVTQTTGTTSTPELAVGSGLGADGSYILNGGTIATGSNSTFRVGDFGGTGVFTQNGGAVILGIDSSFNIGNQGGNGTYNLNAGTVTLDSGLHNMGRVGSQAVFDTYGAGDGILNVAGGLLEVISTGKLILGGRIANVPQGDGTLTQTGGTIRIANTAQLYLSAFGNGTYNLNGGVLEIGGTSLQARYGGSGATGTSAFNLGGGTIRVYGANLNTAVNATLVNNTASTIDTNGLSATWSGVLSGDGHLVKSGLGRLTVTGANTYTGATTISQGVMVVHGSIAQSQRVTVGAGATLGGNGTVGEVDVRGTVDPSIDGGAALLTLQSGGVFASGSSLLWNLATLTDNSTGTAGISWDALMTADLLTFESGALLTLSFSAGGPDDGNAFWDSNHQWDIVLTSGAGEAVDEGLTITNATYGPGSFRVTTQSGTLQLNYDVVPEPTTWALLVIGVALIGGSVLQRWRADRQRATRSGGGQYELCE